MKKITAHCIVKNEDKFIWFAIHSVLPFVDILLVFDTGSTDNTVEIIKSIRNPKIVFEEKGPVDAVGLVALRREQLQRTKTDFFLIVDGDEIWPRQALSKILDQLDSLSEKILGIFCRTRNCVGDVFHYSEEKYNRYRLQDKVGSYNMRLYRKTSQTDISGHYPLEGYTHDGVEINQLTDRLLFVDTWYLHTTHLHRSSLSADDKKVLTRLNKYRYELGLTMTAEDLPVVFQKKYPPQVGNPLSKRSGEYELIAGLVQPIRDIRQATR